MQIDVSVTSVLKRLFRWLGGDDKHDGTRAGHVNVCENVVEQFRLDMLQHVRADDHIGLGFGRGVLAWNGGIIFPEPFGIAECFFQITLAATLVKNSIRFRFLFYRPHHVGPAP